MLFRLALMSFVKLSFLSVFLNLLQELDILLCDQVETAWLAVSLNEFLKFMNVFLLFIPCLNNLHVLVPDELSKEALDWVTWIMYVLLSVEFQSSVHSLIIEMSVMGLLNR